MRDDKISLLGDPGNRVLMANVYNATFVSSTPDDGEVSGVVVDNAFGCGVAVLLLYERYAVVLRV